MQNVMIVRQSGHDGVLTNSFHPTTGTDESQNTQETYIFVNKIPYTSVPDSNLPTT